MLELTTRFEGITTGARPGHGRLSAKQAAHKAIANLRYIARPSAVLSGDTITLNLNDFEVSDPKAAQSIMRDAVRNRAGKGGSKGIRVAEKMMCSLPNDFAGEPAREAVRLIAKRLAAGSPNVRIYAAIHTDRPNNLHAHFLVIDGLETRSQARKRVGDNAKRVRPRSVIRLSDRGRPKELRRMFAGAINEVAERRGLKRVEFRSFKERGVVQKPEKHLGPWRAKTRERDLEQLLCRLMAEPLDTLFPEEQERENEDPVQETLHNIMNGIRKSTRRRSRHVTR